MFPWMRLAVFDFATPAIRSKVSTSDTNEFGIITTNDQKTAKRKAHRMADEERFDVVDDRDQILGQAPRSEVHAQHWLHRAVHIFVFNTRGELLIHQRTATKDECPLMFTSSA